MISNRYELTTGAGVTATDNNNAVTGNQSIRWLGANITYATGAQGNAVAGDRFIYLNSSTNIPYTEQVVSDVISVTWTDVAAQNSYLQIEMPRFAGKKVKGLQVIGIEKPSAVGQAGNGVWYVLDGANIPITAAIREITLANGNGPTLLLKVTGADIITAGNVVNVMVYYSNSVA